MVGTVCTMRRQWIRVVALPPSSLVFLSLPGKVSFLTCTLLRAFPLSLFSLDFSDVWSIGSVSFNHIFIITLDGPNGFSKLLSSKGRNIEKKQITRTKLFGIFCTSAWGGGLPARCCTIFALQSGRNSPSEIGTSRGFYPMILLKPPRPLCEKCSNSRGVSAQFHQSCPAGLSLDSFRNLLQGMASIQQSLALCSPAGLASIQDPLMFDLLTPSFLWHTHLPSPPPHILPPPKKLFHTLIIPCVFIPECHSVLNLWHFLSFHLFPIAANLHIHIKRSIIHIYCLCFLNQRRYNRHSCLP